MHRQKIRVFYLRDTLPFADDFPMLLDDERIELVIVTGHWDELPLLYYDEYDVVVIDYTLSNEYGIHLLKQLRQEEHHTPIIMVTEQQNAESAVNAMRLGSADYIIRQGKSAEYQIILRQTIERVHQKHRERQEIAQRDEREKYKTVNDLRRHNYSLQKINEASQKLAATLNSDEVMLQILSDATSIIGSKDASLWVWEDERREHLVCKATSNSSISEMLSKQRLKPDEGIVGWVVKNGKSTLSHDTKSDPRFAAQVDASTGFQTYSLLAVPLRVRQDILGVLQVVNKLDGIFEQDDIELAEALGTSAAIALENARLIESLQQHTQELKARNEDLDAFAHMIAHDLKTPLLWVTGYTDLLLKDYAKISSAEQQEYLQAIGKGAATMENIINELLLLASLRDASVIIEPVKMEKVIQEAINQLIHTLQGQQVELIYPEKFPVVNGYAPWLEGVWANYMSNALKYGGIPPRIEIGYTEKEEMIMFWIQDNGEGIPSEKLNTLFIPFSRLDRNRAKGHGLGLSIVARIIHKLGGEVGVESRVGYGSRFMFSLPKRVETE